MQDSRASGDLSVNEIASERSEINGTQIEAGDWLDSKEARKELKVSACDLAYLREAGKLRYRKDRNAYGYLKADVQTLKKATAGEKKGI